MGGCRAVKVLELQDALLDGGHQYGDMLLKLEKDET